MVTCVDKCQDFYVDISLAIYVDTELATYVDK